MSRLILNAEAGILCLRGHGGEREPRVEADQWRRRWGPALGGGRIGSASGRHMGEFGVIVNNIVVSYIAWRIFM